MRITTLLVMCSLTACTTTAEAPVRYETSGGLVLHQHDQDRIDGTFGKLTFSAMQIAEHRVQVALRLDSRRVDVDINYALGSATHDAHGAMFSATELVAVDAAAIALDKVLPPDVERSEIERAAAQHLALLAKAPADVSLERFEIRNERSVTCLSCTCQTQYIGNGYYREAGQGQDCDGGYGNGCKGHCGAGCKADNSGNYTRDCARHDYGLASWWDASDDYTFGGCWCY